QAEERHRPRRVADLVPLPVVPELRQEPAHAEELVHGKCKGPASGERLGLRVFQRTVISLAEHANVGRRQALGALGDLEFDLLPLLEATETISLDSRVVAEDVSTAVVLRDEPETLGVVEP